MSENPNQTGTLHDGLVIEGVAQKDFELRPATVGDMIAAESAAGNSDSIKFVAALIACQIARIGTFDGTVTPAMINKLSTRDFAILQHAQGALVAQGEAQ